MSGIGSSQSRLRGYTAEVDLSANQYMFVKKGTAKNTVTAITGAGDQVLGVIQNFRVDGRAGDTVDVALFGGGAFLKMGGAVPSGAEVKTDATGKGVVAVVANDKVGAIADAYGANAADNDVKEVQLTPPYRIHA